MWLIPAARAPAAYGERWLRRRARRRALIQGGSSVQLVCVFAFNASSKHSLVTSWGAAWVTRCEVWRGLCQLVVGSFHSENQMEASTFNWVFSVWKSRQAPTSSLSQDLRPLVSPICHSSSTLLPWVCPAVQWPVWIWVLHLQSFAHFHVPYLVHVTHLSCHDANNFLLMLTRSMTVGKCVEKAPACPLCRQLVSPWDDKSCMCVCACGSTGLFTAGLTRLAHQAIKVCMLCAGPAYVNSPCECRNHYQGACQLRTGGLMCQQQASRTLQRWPAQLTAMQSPSACSQSWCHSCQQQTLVFLPFLMAIRFSHGLAQYKGQLTQCTKGWVISCPWSFLLTTHSRHQQSSLRPHASTQM